MPSMRAAQTMFESKQFVGKIVLVPADENA
jgi:hypothetical protein